MSADDFSLVDDGFILPKPHSTHISVVPQLRVDAQPDSGCRLPAAYQHYMQPLTSLQPSKYLAACREAEQMLLERQPSKRASLTESRPSVQAAQEHCACMAQACVSSGDSRVAADQSSSNRAASGPSATTGQYQTRSAAQRTEALSRKYVAALERLVHDLSAQLKEQDGVIRAYSSSTYILSRNSDPSPTLRCFCMRLHAAFSRCNVNCPGALSSAQA